MIPVSVTATSSVVGPIELELGFARLRRSGFDPRGHPRVLDRHFVSAGRDEDRLAALVDCAFDSTTRILWCARGGYGAGKLMPMLESATEKRGRPPQKLLVGYSDVTPLLEFVRTRWGWSSLHGPMVSATRSGPSQAEWDELDALVKGQRISLAYEEPVLKWRMNAPSRPLTGELVGGNLSLWHTLAGTRYQPSMAGKILFLEDIGEKLYALDRYVVQLEQSGMLDGCAAIVLGDFTDCADESPVMLDPKYNAALVDWENHPRVSARRSWSLEEGLLEIFGRVCEAKGIPLATGLPVGHGPNYHPLPLGARYELTTDGRLKLLSWDWLRE
jgi:muramoyltetrapeptide carboxypeptidase